MVHQEIKNQKEYPKVAVVGTGYWGKNLVRNFHSIGALEALCEQDNDRLNEFNAKYPDCACYQSFSEVLAQESVDAVAIATPAETHASLVREALEAGKDVFVEKPLCLSVEEGQRLVHLARETNKILMVGHLLWYHPAVLKLKDLISEGALGRIQYIYSNRLNLGKIRQEENILWSFAPHDISVILGLVGELPDQIQAQGGAYLHQQIADVTVSLLSFPSGVKAHIFVSWLHPYKEQKLVVVGDRKMAVFNDLEEKDKLLLYPHSIEWKNQVPIPNKAEAQRVDLNLEEPLRAECLHFLHCVQSRQRPRTDGEEGLRVLSVLHQCEDALGVQASNIQNTSTKAPLPYFVHESAIIDDDVKIDKGTKIWHFSHILKGSRIGKDCNLGQNVVVGPNVRIGKGVKIQNNVSVYEGVTLEDSVFCGPSMVFTNIINPRSEIRRMSELRSTLVKKGASLGANCTVLCGVTIGKYAFVGAGTMVTKDVPDYALVYGVPAKSQGWMCECGEKLSSWTDEIAICGSCKSQYKKSGTAVNLIKSF